MQEDFKDLRKLSSFAKNQWHTLYNVILRIAWNLLETRKNIKISTHPFYYNYLD